MKASRLLHSSPISAVVLISTLILSFIIRIKGILEESFAFTYDVGRDLLAVRDIIVHHNLLFIGPTTGLPGVFYGPWWYYLLVPSYLIGAGSPTVVAAFMVLTGTVTAILGYSFGRKLGSTFLGLFIAGLLSFSPVMHGFTTQIWNPNIAPLIVMLFYVLLVSAVMLDKNALLGRCLPLFLSLGVLAGLSLDAEIVFGTLFIGSVIISIALLFRSMLTLKRIGIFLVGIVLVLSPRILFEIKNNFIMVRTLLSSFTGVLPGGSELPFLERIPQRLGFLFQMWTDSVAAGIPLLGLFELLIVVIVSVLYISKIDILARKIYLFSLLIISVFYIGLLFFSHDIWPHYIVGLPVVFIILFGIAIHTIMHVYRNLRPGIVVALVLLVVLNIQPVRIWDSFTQPLWEGDASVYRNQKSVVEYVYHEAGGRPFKYIVYTPPLHDYTYSYLFSWLGEKRYNYIPDPTSDKLFFVILEPDHQYPERLTDWLKQRKNDGKIIKEKSVKGGIVVQTRINP